MSSKITNLILSLTGECNYSCLYCYASNYAKNRMTFEIAKKAIDIVSKANNNFIIQFTGGEPLIEYELIKKVVNYVEKNKIKAIFQIQTNASLITNEKAKFIKAHKIGIGVSLDGRPKINDLQRKKGNGEGTAVETIKGINILSANDIAIGLTCVITDKNVKDLKGIVEVAYYLGNVRKIGFDLLRGQGRGSNLKEADPIVLENSLREVFDLAQKLELITGVKINFTQIDSATKLKKSGIKGTFAHCDAMTGKASVVDSFGNIYACPSLIGNRDFYIGNVKEGIDEDKVDFIKNKIEKFMTKCNQCNNLTKCGGACFARVFGHEQNEDKLLVECTLKKVSIDYANKAKYKKKGVTKKEEGII
jgi:uncharacterized protein